MDDDALRAFSVWSNLSECTFVLPPVDEAADYSVRIFSLESELSFAGHPTLGTTRARLDAGGVPATPGMVIQECQAGLIPIRVDGDKLALAAPASVRSGPVDDPLLDILIDILGVTREEVLDAAWLNNGPGWVGLLLDSAATVLRLTPDASAHPGRWDIGVIGAYQSNCETAFEVQAFFSEGEGALCEDPVTGSLNAAAAGWLIGTGRASAPYVASQGTVMGRRGRVNITLDQGQLWVGGRACVVVSGTLTL